MSPRADQVGRGRRRPGTLPVCAGIIALLLVLAILAPFLAHRSPLLLKDAAGWSSPVCAELGGEDLAWLVGGVTAAALLVAGRRLRQRTARRRRVWRWGLLAAGLAGTLACLQVPDRLHPDRWARWDQLRQGEAAEGVRVWWTPLGFGPDHPEPGAPLKAPPGGRHLLGTDDAGRDVAARLVHGARVSLLVGFLSTAVALVVGVALGSLAGYRGGWVDQVVSRGIEVFLCFPHLFLLLIVFAYLPRGLGTFAVLLGLLTWPHVARIARGECQRLRSADFVLAARAMGVGPLRVLAWHVLPNAAGALLVTAAFGVANAILAEASLSFLGFGVPAPRATWGQMIQAGFVALDQAPWLTFLPGALVFLSVAAFHFLAEALRDAWDPRGDR